MNLTLLLPALLPIAAALSATTVRAQTITWGPVIPTIAATDVSLVGSLVVARNLHSATAAQSPTVNGVPFVGSFGPLGWTNASTLAMNGSTTGDAGYDLLLNSARATSGVTANPTGWGAIRIDNLGTLTVGRSYQIQCWFTDQRLGTGTAALYDRAMTLSSAIGAATLTGGEVNNLGALVQGPLSGPLDGDPDNNPALGGTDVLYGSWCLGTFTRTSATDQLWLLVQGSHPIAANPLRSHLTAFQIRELPAASVTPFGTGCDGLGLAAVGLPTIGNASFALNVTNVPLGPIGFVGLGYTSVPGGIDLTPDGMAGCFLYNLLEIGVFNGGPVVSGTSTFALGIPNTPSLASALLSAQGASLSLATTLGYASSNGVEFVIGY